MRPSLRWILPLAVVGSALGQEAAARRVMEARSSVTAGSSAWFESGFELVEAQLQFDVAAAVRTATELQAAARSSSLPDVADVAQAMVGLVRSVHQGPAAATPAAAGAAPASNATPASARHRARLHTARARSGRQADAPAEFLPEMFTALAAARAADDPALLHRAVWLLHGVLEPRAPQHDAELLREIGASATEPAVGAFAAWKALQEYWLASSGLTRAERLPRLDDIDRIADEVGDLRTRVHAGWDRVVVAMAGDEKDLAATALTALQPLAERLGDCRVLGVHFELAAELAIERGRPEEAAELLARAVAVAGGRGLPDREVQQAHLRLRLATNRSDAEAMAAEAQLLGRLRADEEARYRGFAPLLEHLLTGEREKLVLSQQRDRSAQTLRLVLVAGLAVCALVSAVLALLMFRSRRRLQQTHAALQGEVARGERELVVRRGLEQRLQQIERTQSLGLVAGGVAHDFNNLMVAVVGNADLLRADERDPQRARLLEAIVAAGERGSRLCVQLQGYAGNQVAKTERFDLRAQLRELVPVLEAAAGPSLRLSVAEGGEPIWLTGSATEVEQVLLNLLTNARDAKATQVRIDVSPCTMRDDDWRGLKVRGTLGNGAFACLEVEDDGEGMGDDVQERVFDPFFTTRFPGRGLGLAVVFGAVQRHRGAIVVDSACGRGTRFRVYLPLQAGAEVPAAVAPPAAMATATVAPMTVLVVDDEAPVRELLTGSLTRRGHRVVAIGNGRDLAFSLPGLDRSDRAIALVDLSMPGLDGRDVVRRLRELHPGLPIALMSGHAPDHLAEVARELGAAGCITKPFRPTELERMLDGLLAGSSPWVRPDSNSGAA